VTFSKRNLLVVCMLPIWLFFVNSCTDTDNIHQQPMAYSNRNYPSNGRETVTANKYMKIKHLNRLALANAEGSVADVSIRQLLPIPVIHRDGLRIVFLICPALAIPKQPVKMAPPQYMLSLNAVTGEREEFHAVTSRDFGLSHQRNELVGTFAIPDGMTASEFSHKLDRLFEIYDELLPVFVQNEMRLNDDIKKATKEFQQLFVIVSEPPMLPYYRAAGKDFFTWVDNVSR